MVAAQRRGDHAGNAALHRLPRGGRKTPFCDQLCPIRSCVREKGLDTCAGCAQLASCETLGRITNGNPAAMENLQNLLMKKEN